jgi:hypothetical protein
MRDAMITRKKGKKKKKNLRPNQIGNEGGGDYGIKICDHNL